MQNSKPQPKKDEHGALYEDMDGERETGDGDGDMKFVLGDCLTPEQLAKLFGEDSEKTPK